MNRIRKNVLSTIEIISGKRYILLSATVLCLLLIKVINGFWVGDFWLHSAVVREFSLNPFSPTNPFLPVNTQHFYHGPYHWIVGFFAKVFGLSSITALGCMGLLNFAVFSYSLHLFCRMLNTARHTAFYALVFSLVLWGEHPWLYSSFFHLGTIGFCFPYPSFFCIGLALLSFALFIETLQHNKKFLFLSIIPLSAIVMLSHTSTSIVLFAGLGIILISNSSLLTVVRNSIKLTVIILCTLGLVYLWPHLSLFALLSQKTNFVSHYILDDLTLYRDVLAKIWPTLFTVPFIIIRLYKNPKDTLGLLFLGFSAVYFWGFFTKQWSYGRSIAQTILIAHIIFADWFASLKSRSDIPRDIRYAIAACMIILLLVSMRNLPVTFWSQYRIQKIPEYSNLNFIAELTHRENIVLTDRYSGILVPSFGGKVVAYDLIYKGQEPFVSDGMGRIKDMEHFFDEKTSAFDRKQILKKYNVGFVLINRDITPLHFSLSSFLKDNGSVEYDREQYVLFSINRPDTQ